MVSFIAKGRMGNFLFEAATSFAYSKKHNLEFTVPHKSSDDFHNPVYLHHLRNPSYNINNPIVEINEYQHNYQDLPFKEDWISKNIILKGYWQTEKYFKMYRKDILDAFNYHWQLNKGIVSVHIRRGDYLVLREKHPYIGEEWILEAMSKFKGYKFKFFSDDIVWAKEKFGSRDDCMFSEGNTIEQDLIDGSCCEHHINSSSTYSWWMAWLNHNPNKIIYTPKQWFISGHGGTNTSDIIPEDWIKI